MLIKFEQAIKDHGMQIRGVIHVGGHYGQEYEAYKAAGINNIVFVEPCTPAFNNLKLKIDRFGDPGVVLIKCALGDKPGRAIMNTEEHNKGMSNSLLKPKAHLEHYPDIQFTAQEEVDVQTLDSLPVHRALYNLLMMDVQGYEKFVLMGGPETLVGIDYVYTEVNDAELYEGCTMIGDIDKILVDFDRVQTHWVNKKGWGDAIYIRRKEKMIMVPAEFQPHQKNAYPPGNNLAFEEWLSQNPIKYSSDRHYLPIHWTAYYVNNRHGKDVVALDKLQQYINQLDPQKKYWTVVQYDDGILNNVDRLDIKVIAMCGPRIDYPIPLLCQPHKYTPNLDDNHSGEMDIFASFVGKVTHPIRGLLLRSLRDEIIRVNGSYSYFLNERHMDISQYCNVVSRSIFTLCPRGYGSTSFRILEAMQYNSIPVYISDDFVEPYGIAFEEYGVRIHEIMITRVHKILSEIPPEEIQKKRDRIKELWPLFQYEGARNKIAEQLGQRP